MAASAPSSLFQQARYRGTSGAWHVAMRRLQARAWVLALALMGGGCSVSYQLDSVLANKDAGAAAEADSPRAAAPKTTAEMPAETDLAIARAAVSEVLIKGGRHSSVPWENPKTGARGNRYTPRLGLQSGWDHLPRFSRQLREERHRVMVAGCGLPRQTRQVGSAQFAALEQHLASSRLPTLSRYTLTAVMIPLGKISSGAAWRCAIPCSWV